MQFSWIKCCLPAYTQSSIDYTQLICIANSVLLYLFFWYGEFLLIVSFFVWLICQWKERPYRSYIFNCNWLYFQNVNDYFVYVFLFSSFILITACLLDSQCRGQTIVEFFLFIIFIFIYANVFVLFCLFRVWIVHIHLQTCEYTFLNGGIRVNGMN